MSAFRRERRKSEIGTASTMERRPAPLPSNPVRKLSLTATGTSMRSPTNMRSYIPERRFSTGSGGADRPSRRASDSSVLSVDTSSDMKKRLSMRLQTAASTSPAPFNMSPSKMAGKEYSFSEIYDSTTKLDADADLDKVTNAQSCCASKVLWWYEKCGVHD